MCSHTIYQKGNIWHLATSDILLLFKKIAVSDSNIEICSKV